MENHIKVMQDALLKQRAHQPVFGPVEQSFDRAAKIASLWLDRDISARDVALISAAIKMSHLAVTPDHSDSFVDLCNLVSFGAAFSHAQWKGKGNSNGTDVVGDDDFHQKLEAAIAEAKQSTE